MSMRRTRPQPSAERGSALIETSLVMLVAMTALIATFDVGQFLFFHQNVAERARLAARYGALNWDRGCNAQCVQNMMIYRQPTAPDGGIPSDRVAIAGLRASNVVVTVPDPATQGWDARVVVRIQGWQVKSYTPWLFSSGGFTARAITATAPVEAPN